MSLVLIFIEMISPLILQLRFQICNFEIWFRSWYLNLSLKIVPKCISDLIDIKAILDQTMVLVSSENNSLHDTNVGPILWRLIVLLEAS